MIDPLPPVWQSEMVRLRVLLLNWPNPRMPPILSGFLDWERMLELRKAHPTTELKESKPQIPPLLLWLNVKSLPSTMQPEMLFSFANPQMPPLLIPVVLLTVKPVTLQSIMAPL